MCPVQCVTCVSGRSVSFKPLVIAQGVFQVPFVTYVIGTFVGRGLLFFFEGFLGARYGVAGKQFILTQKWTSLALALGVALLFLVIRRVPVPAGRNILRQTEVRERGAQVPARSRWRPDRL